MGRWMSRDPIDSSVLYVFVENDAIIGFDMLGLAHDEFMDDVSEISPDLKVPYSFDPELISKHISDINRNLNEHKHDNQICPTCPEPKFVGLSVYAWRLVKRNYKTETFDYPLFDQLMHIEFDVVNSFTIGGGLSVSKWGISGSRRIEKRDHVSIVGSIRVFQRVVVKSYEWNCVCSSSMYGQNIGRHYFPWRRYYEEPTYYLIGKWLAAKMSVTPIDGGSSWTVEGSVNGFSIQYGRE